MEAFTIVFGANKKIGGYPGIIYYSSKDENGKNVGNVHVGNKHVRICPSISKKMLEKYYSSLKKLNELKKYLESPLNKEKLFLNKNGKIYQPPLKIYQVDYSIRHDEVYLVSEKDKGPGHVLLLFRGLAGANVEVYTYYQSCMGVVQGVYKKTENNSITHEALLCVRASTKQKSCVLVMMKDTKTHECKYYEIVLSNGTLYFYERVFGLNNRKIVRGKEKAFLWVNVKKRNHECLKREELFYQQLDKFYSEQVTKPVDN